MSEIEKIILFHALKLQPVLKIEVEKWSEIKVNQHLISVYCIEKCFVQIEDITPLLPSVAPTPSPVASEASQPPSQLSPYGLRKKSKEKKACWCMC